jgi:T5SS/PEP-CTERM-associated repeat protein
VGFNTGSSGTVTVSGAGSSWTNNNLFVGADGTGTLAIDSGGTVNTATNGHLGFSAGGTGAVTVGGAGATWNSGGSLYIGGTENAAFGTGQLTINNGGIVNVNNTLKIWDLGTVDLNGGTLNVGTLDPFDGTFNFNAGALNFGLDLLVDTSGVLGSSINLSSTRSLGVAGTTTLNGASTLTLDGGTFSTGSLLDNGGFVFNSGTFNITSDNLLIGTGGLFGRRAVFDFDQTVNVTNNLIIDTDATLSLRGGQVTAADIGNYGVIEMTDSLSEVGGIALNNFGLVHGSGTFNTLFTNALGGEIRANLGETLTFSGSSGAALNPGRITLLGGTLDFTEGLNSSGQIVGHGTLITGPTATLINTGAMAFSDTTNVIGDVHNDTGGSILVSGGSTTTFHDDVIHNGAQFSATAGSQVVFFGEADLQGPLSGGGLFWFEGDITPGSSPGLVSVQGDVGLGLASHTIMEIAGLERGAEYDAFSIDGSLWLGGALDVVLYDAGSGSFTPQLGDSFDLFMADTITGDFDLLTLASLGGGLGWQLDFLADEIGTTDVLRLSVVSAVPVPPAVWLFGSGLLWLIAISRRRRAV